MGQNLAVAEWLVSMGIMGLEGYVRLAIAFWYMNILHIGHRWMIQHHNLGHATW